MSACTQQVNFTTIPSQGFVGSFAGPLYSPGNAVPTCGVLINTGLGTQVSPTSQISRAVATTRANACGFAALIAPFARSRRLGHKTSSNASYRKMFCCSGIPTAPHLPASKAITTLQQLFASCRFSLWLPKSAQQTQTVQTWQLFHSQLTTSLEQKTNAQGPVRGTS